MFEISFIYSKYGSEKRGYYFGKPELLKNALPSLSIIRKKTLPSPDNEFKEEIIIQLSDEFQPPTKMPHRGIFIWG